MKHLFIVLTVLLITVAVAAPYLNRGAAPGTEPVVVWNLRAVRGAQETFRGTVQLDRDGDGIAEYGDLTSLSRVDPPLLGGPFGRPDAAGLVTAGGYRYRLCLPEGPDAAERRWCCYAWPDAGSPERVAYVITHEGMLLRALDSGYRGDVGPEPDAAFLPGGGPAVEEEGADGNVWSALGSGR
jgi:hypothetical protein